MIHIIMYYLRITCNTSVRNIIILVKKIVFMYSYSTTKTITIKKLEILSWHNLQHYSKLNLKKINY